MFNLKTTTLKSTTLVVALLALSQVSPAATNGSTSVTNLDESFAQPTTASQREVSELLKDIRVTAFEARYHAARLDTFVRNTNSRLHSWQAHSWELSQVREKVNMKGKALKQLQTLKSEALPWQQRAIDRIQPLLSSLAENTTVAINHLTKNRQHLKAPQYTDAISNMYIYADEVCDVIGVKFDYVEARAKLKELDAEAEKH